MDVSISGVISSVEDDDGEDVGMDDGRSEVRREAKLDKQQATHMYNIYNIKDIQHAINTKHLMCCEH